VARTFIPTASGFDTMIAPTTSDPIEMHRAGASRPVTEERTSRLPLEIARPIPRAEGLADRIASDVGFEPRPRSERIDRTINVTLAIAGLILAFPLMLLCGLLIKLTSPGPIFYSQARVGLDRRRQKRSNAPYDRRSRNLGGRPFMIFKFRTMRTDAETKVGAVWASPGDTRVTRVGKFMRKYRVDELPQLINVLRGEMNIVGPRPERPSIFVRLSDDISEYSLRQRARPGITGWAQVNNSYDTNLDDVRRKVRYDLEYLQRQGVGEDLMIMARTVPVMLFRKGGW
jgi:lipopolysaccharide/colanic/teichoic acid biosynthesis glycosyltransferase